MIIPNSNLSRATIPYEGGEESRNVAGGEGVRRTTLPSLSQWEQKVHTSPIDGGQD